MKDPLNNMIIILVVIVLSLAFCNKARSEITAEQEQEKVEYIFQAIESELDKTDLKLEYDSDRIMTILIKILISHGYTTENSGIEIAGSEDEDRKFIEMIRIQIHGIHRLYEFIYTVDWSGYKDKTA